ncbi:MAG: glycosyl hydrolase family 28 protein [Phycisphaerae bacterium]
MSDHITTYPYPYNAPRSEIFEVSACGHDVFVYQADGGDFAAFSCAEPVELRIKSTRPWRDVKVTPTRLGITPRMAGDTLVLQLPGPMNLLVTAPGVPDLYVYANRPEADTSANGGGPVRRYEAGKIHEVGELQLVDGESVYIEGGAVVRGCIRASGMSNIQISGPGVLEDSVERQAGRWRRSMVLQGCHDGLVKDIVMVEPAGWMITLGACRRMMVHGVRQIGTIHGSDGVDICGSSVIRVEGCMLRNGDDCVVVKALGPPNNAAISPHSDWSGDVDDILVSDCLLLSYRGGCALEVGHETRANHMRNIRFADCTVLGVHEFGAPLGIHAGDRALIENVTYENIMIEHHYDKLVDFRIIRSRWSRDPARGKVRGITLKNINVVQSPYNAGYTTSLIGGYSDEYNIADVKFDNFRIAEKHVLHPDDMDLYTKHATGISFR